jgi:WD40 repeat protein
MFILGKQPGPVRALALAPDGLTLAAAGNKAIHLWELARRRPQVVIEGASGIAHRVSSGPCLAFAPDGETLAGHGANTVKVWQTGTGELYAQFAVPPGNWVSGAPYGPDGESLNVCLYRPAGGQTEVQVVRWDLATREVRTCLQWQVPHATYVLTVSPSQRLLAALVGPPRELLVGGVGSPPERTPLSFGAYRALLFAPDGRTLALRSPHVLSVWDRLAREMRLTLRAEQQINDFAVSPDSRLLLTGGNDSHVRLHDLATGPELAAFDWGIGKVDAVAFAPDGMTAAAGGHGGRIVVWDVDTD